MAAAAIPLAVTLAGSLIGAGAGALFAPKPKMPAAAAVITRNDAAINATQDRQFRQRRGAGANELTGGGAEAPSPGGKGLLGQ